MSSFSSPCSGFVQVNDAGKVCAGFRQCGSSKGTTGLNPRASNWDVPLEVRCSSDLTAWSRPEYLFPVFYYRALPYDPVRPWKDFDNKWYVALSTDGCNSTTRSVPCAAGGQLDLWTSEYFDGPWEKLETPMLTTNQTMLGDVPMQTITAEFVTSGYFGALQGDPEGGKTRVVTQNRAGATYCEYIVICFRLAD